MKTLSIDEAKEIITLFDKILIIIGAPTLTSTFDNLKDLPPEIRDTVLHKVAQDMATSLDVGMSAMKVTDEMKQQMQGIIDAAKNIDLRDKQ